MIRERKEEERKGGREILNDVKSERNKTNGDRQI